MNKSLLRYPGGKTRAAKHILPFFPDNIKKLCSPFFGGGSIELELASRGVEVKGYDKFKPVVCFWQTLLQDPQSLYLEVKSLHDKMDKSVFKQMQKDLSENKDIWEPLKVAAYYYALNRSSFSGTVLSGGYSTPNHPRFNESSVERILQFNIDNLSVDFADFEDSIVQNEESFLYCDPPYLLEKNKNKLYGNRGDMHQDFPHEKLADILSKRKNWILSYNNSQEVRSLYKGYVIVEPEWKYGMSSDKNSKEILVINI